MRRFFRKNEIVREGEFAARTTSNANPHSDCRNECLIFDRIVEQDCSLDTRDLVAVDHVVPISLSAQSSRQSLAPDADHRTRHSKLIKVLFPQPLVRPKAIGFAVPESSQVETA